MVNCLQSINELSTEEQLAVNQLKQRMVGSMDIELFEDVNIFIRFLRARDMNLNAAEAMLRKHLEWRKIHQIDKILTNFTGREVLKKFVTLDVMGPDRDGSPILYFHIGHADPRGILKSARKIEIVKYVVQKLERAVAVMEKESLRRGIFIDKWTIIINFEGLQFSVATHKETLELAGNLIVMYEGNYPERLKVAYFINASIYFTMAFGVVKHFISGPTYKKIKIFGKEGWRDELLKVVDPNLWPAFLGGNLTDPDGNPDCLTHINHGGLVPESYYLKKKENSLANIPGIDKLTVSRMSKTQLTVNVTEPGCHIEWEFETKSRDIAFCLLYKKNVIDPILKEIIPKQRVDTNIAAETGLFKCEKPGILKKIVQHRSKHFIGLHYVIEFDNSYSWVFQKEVYYRVSVVKNSINIE